MRNKRKLWNIFQPTFIKRYPCLRILFCLYAWYTSLLPRSATIASSSSSSSLASLSVFIFLFALYCLRLIFAAGCNQSTLLIQCKILVCRRAYIADFSFRMCMRPVNTFPIDAHTCIISYHTQSEHIRRCNLFESDSTIVVLSFMLLWVLKYM